MSYMSKDSAERHSDRTPFPFPTWDGFLREFRLWFIEENEQDHALLKLESRSYHMGTRDVFKYTDDFEDLVDLAGFEDPIVKVTKYRTGLDPAINSAITGSSDPPGLRDYPAWRLRAYRQYESQLRTRNTGGPSRHPVGPARPLAMPSRPPQGLLPPMRTAPPPVPPPVPMDIDRTRARATPRRGCYRCGDPNHLARHCSAPADIRSADILDEVIQQLGDELLGELLARVASTWEVEAHAAYTEQEDFPLRDE